MDSNPARLLTSQEKIKICTFFLQTRNWWRYSGTLPLAGWSILKVEVSLTLTKSALHGNYTRISRLCNMKIVILSDTHGFHEQITIPCGDILIYAGDICHQSTINEIIQFDKFLAQLPHRYKIIIAGNHDFPFQNAPYRVKASLCHCIYLQDSGIEIEGIKIYGSPWQPWFFDWAFNLQRGRQIKEKWDLIPDDTDVLITHGPPFGILDTVDGHSEGCEELLKAIYRIKPKYHIFGHIHEGYGQSFQNNTLFINASICNEHYQPVHDAHICEWGAV
ncbi:MAG: metallophosphatase domain-containing protein [bacterium]